MMPKLSGMLCPEGLSSYINEHRFFQSVTDVIQGKKKKKGDFLVIQMANTD